MAKNRIIYQSQALYAGKPAANGTYSAEVEAADRPKNLQRIQNINYSFDIARTDVNQFGNLANIDRVILESPTVSLDFSYYFADFSNEKTLGFTIMNSATPQSALTNMLTRATDERNYYVKVVDEGNDAVDFAITGTGSTASGFANDVIGIGNGFVSSYTHEAAVGDFPTCSLTVEALNIKFDKGTTGNYIPKISPTDGTAESSLKYSLPTAARDRAAVSPSYSAVRPGDITLSTLSNGGLGAKISDAKIQSYSLSFDLAREPLQRLGNKFAFAREMTFPVTVSLSVDALVGDFDDANLATVISSDNSQDITITLKSGSAAHCKFQLKGAKLDGHSYSNSIGDNKSVTMNFSSQIGSSQQTDVGLFMSGAGSTATVW